jgi:hypothetical protein
MPPKEIEYGEGILRQSGVIKQEIRAAGRVTREIEAGWVVVKSEWNSTEASV